MLSSVSNCSTFEAEYRRVLNLTETVNWLSNYQSLISYLSDQCGRCARSLRSLYLLGENIVDIKNENLQLPSWLNSTQLKQLEELYNVIFDYLFRTELEQRLRAGMFLNELRKQMFLIKKCKKFYPVRIYSTNDDIIVATLTALGVYDQIPPWFGATVMFEFRCSRNKRNKFIRIYYLNDTYSENPIRLDISRCGNGRFCSFEKFAGLIRKFIPNNWRKECGFED
ncbi:lysosomal acid phosphatase-like isoform X2 [Leptotrombidium deliense]|uniref:acid phosphatase n=1 Tax=Leptotrombidium deliense TaxID=299467 RepID=A0A443RWX9_9ACAR|nr:lysosomal acid phosphatase-like isoform X2 [Leptotrombidium deliense]